MTDAVWTALCGLVFVAWLAFALYDLWRLR